MDNRLEFLIAAWGAQRAGLFFVPVNWHLSAAEATYVVNDSGARAIVASAQVAELAMCVVAQAPELTVRLMVGAAIGPFESFADTLLDFAADRPPVEPNGYPMFYSSGTTGRPKGIKPDLPTTPFGTPLILEPLLEALYRFGADSVYLSTGPLYHAAPMGWSLCTQALGGRVAIMDRFDAENCLAMIEKHRVTHAQFVPTMFVRLLKLAPELRARYDLSSLQVVVHAAAPCPVAVKRQMIEWFGPIVYEYYAGSEANCFFAVDSVEWLLHPGTVGKPLLGNPHVLDDDGVELAEGEIGQIWIEGPTSFRYHNDEAKTATAYNDRGWSTLGDVGHLDGEGYLYLSDRRTDLIITGGVNVYPREIEDALAMHPAVADVAVIGVAHEEMGQEIVAVVEPADGVVGDGAMEAVLMGHAADQLARFKQPRRVIFTDELPRLPSGKILRRVVRERYGDNTS